MQPGSLRGMVLAHGLGPRSKACMLRNDPGCPQSPLGQFPRIGRLVPSLFSGLTSRSRATVIKMVQPHMPARPRRWRVRRPARSTKNTCRESQGLPGAFRAWDVGGIGWLGSTKGWTFRTPSYVQKPTVGPFQRPAVTETKVKTVLTTPAPMVA